jgi:hypothetical protein
LIFEFSPAISCGIDFSHLKRHFLLQLQRRLSGFFGEILSGALVDYPSSAID